MDTLFQQLPSFSTTPLELDQSLQQIDIISKKWQQTKETVESIKTTLINSMADTFKNSALKNWRGVFAKFLDQLASKVVSTYDIIADMNRVKNEHNDLVTSNSVLQEFVPSLQNTFTKLNASLLQITLKPFQSKIYIDSGELLESVTRVDDLHSLTKIIYFSSNESLPTELERVLGKRIADKDLTSMTRFFKEKLLVMLDKRIDALHAHLKRVLEESLMDVFEKLQMGVGKITAKISYLQSMKCQAEDNSEIELTVQNSINDFLFRLYPSMAQEFQKHIKSVLSDEFLTPCLQDALKQLFKGLTNEKESTANKVNLHQFFLFEQAKVTYNSVLPTCMMVLKHAKPPRKIDVVLCGEDNHLKAGKLKGLPIFQLNYVYFTAICKNADTMPNLTSSSLVNDSILGSAELSEYVLYTNDPTEVEEMECWQLGLDFLPPNLEISKHESVILYFFAKLAQDGMSKLSADERQNLLKNSITRKRKKTDEELEDQDLLTLKISIETFFSFFFSYLKNFIYANPEETKNPEEGFKFSAADFDALNESMLSAKHFNESSRENSIPVQELKPFKQDSPEIVRNNPVRKTFEPETDEMHILSSQSSQNRDRTFSLPSAVRSNKADSSQLYDTELDLNFEQEPRKSINSQSRGAFDQQFSTAQSEEVKTEAINTFDSTGSNLFAAESAQQTNFNTAKVKDIDTFDNLVVSDLADVDHMWESCDGDIFRNLTEKGQYRFFNDLNTFKEISGCMNYLIIDKQESTELYREFLACKNSHALSSSSKLSSHRNEDLNNPTTKKLLCRYNSTITKGIILLFLPKPQFHNILAVKINFEMKTKTFFLMENPTSDLSVIKDTLSKLIKYMKHTIKKTQSIKYKFSKFKEQIIFLELPNSSLVMKGFENFYFPYLKLVREEFLTSSETFSLEILRESLFAFLYSVYDSKFGLENFRNLLQVYQVFRPRFQNIFLVDEFYSMDSFYTKVHQFLSICFVDNLESYSIRKVKSLMLLARIFNEKSRSFDIVVLYFDYTYSSMTQTGNTTAFDESFISQEQSASNFKASGLQNFYVFGDTYLYLVQVRNIVKTFFVSRSETLQRVQFNFSQMNKAKTHANLFHLEKTILYCIVCILTNEGLQIQDILSICRLSPSIQYNYFCLTLEKVRSMNQKQAFPKQNLFVSNPSICRVRSPNTVNLIQETYKTIERLGLTNQNVLRTQVELTNRQLTLKRIIVYMDEPTPNQMLKPQKESNGAFTIDMKGLRLPAEPFTMVIVNKSISANNPNICNVIEPDGTIYILKISAENFSQPKQDRAQEGILKSIEYARKGLPRLKNHKLTVNNHIMFFKNLSWEHIRPLIDFIIIFYLNKYKSSKDFRFIISENSLLSLICSESKLYFRNFADNGSLLRAFKENTYQLYAPCSLALKTSKSYHSDYLNTLFAIFFMSQRIKTMVFCIHSDMEYTYHIVYKEKTAAKLNFIMICLKDQSHGLNARNYYQELLNLVQRDLANTEIQCEMIRMELDPVASFFYSADSDLLLLGLVDILTSEKTQAKDGVIEKTKIVDVLNIYLESWYRPSILSSQLIGLNDRLKTAE